MVSGYAFSAALDALSLSHPVQPDGPLRHDAIVSRLPGSLLWDEPDSGPAAPTRAVAIRRNRRAAALHALSARHGDHSGGWSVPAVPARLERPDSPGRGDDVS